jgi:hypothetical protein
MSDAIVIRNPVVVMAAREEAARIVADWTAGERLWMPLAAPVVEAAVAEAVAERLGFPVVLEPMYSALRRGEYAGHQVLAVEADDDVEE